MFSIQTAIIRMYSCENFSTNSSTLRLCCEQCKVWIPLQLSTLMGPSLLHSVTFSGNYWRNVSKMVILQL